MLSLEAAMLLLTDALLKPAERERLVREFQSLVWDSKEPPAVGRVGELLVDLADDLENYVSEPHLRAESRLYYDDARVEQKIRSTLRALQEQGVALPQQIDL